MGSVGGETAQDAWVDKAGEGKVGHARDQIAIGIGHRITRKHALVNPSFLGHVEGLPHIGKILNRRGLQNGFETWGQDCVCTPP